ncbi:diguanylate cyclase (GGDEF)-like protein [Pseudomonas duriflava]|uniref:diguanylate cyclase n=1 Tax=Pseudomonas duriflava TaxID=459528 RepID=A0A562Q8Z9_9PSED|nr:diguanylate cyclase [Pseudomonas duriflava]TWI52506.1 diguanylate cyclase (GGDEF)-like protein [Pseudomonas duriflava]
MNAMAGRTPVVLIVDDEKTNLRLLSEVLRGEAKVVLAKSGTQALDKAARERPDLILLDVVMPGLDGLQLIRLFRQRAETASIPVLFISGLDDVKQEVECFELGASDYILKPFNAPAVRARVRLHLQLARQRDMLERLAHIDPLTSLANRRKLDETLAQEWSLAAQERIPLSIAMIDVDYFKQFNDAYGHAAGDEALARVASVLESRTRECDCLARYGGEEFTLILPGTSSEQARLILERCRLAVMDLHIPSAKEAAYEWLTVSIGIAACLPERHQAPEYLMSAADELLYQAKQKGRNRTVAQNLK